MINWLIQYSRAVLLVLVASNIGLAIVLTSLNASEQISLGEPVAATGFSETAALGESTALSGITALSETTAQSAPSGSASIELQLVQGGVTQQLAEQPSTGPAQANGAEVAPVTEEPILQATVEPRVAKVCRVWGPEREAEQFGDLQHALESTGGFPEIIENQVVGRADYLVYVDAYESASMARRMAGELQALNIETYRINRQSGVILSVGVFSREELANAQVERLQKLGYTALIEELSRAQTVYNLRAFVAVNSPLIEESTSACPQSEIGQS